MFFTDFWNENFSLLRTWIIFEESEDGGITNQESESEITNNEYYKHDLEK